MSVDQGNRTFAACRISRDVQNHIYICNVYAIILAGKSLWVYAYLMHIIIIIIIIIITVLPTRRIRALQRSQYR